MACPPSWYGRRLRSPFFDQLSSLQVFPTTRLSSDNYHFLTGTVNSIMIQYLQCRHSAYTGAYPISFPMNTPAMEDPVIPSTSFSTASAFTILSSFRCFGSGLNNRTPWIFHFYLPGRSSLTLFFFYICRK